MIKTLIIDNATWISKELIFDLSLIWVSSKHKPMVGKQDKSLKRLCNHNYRLLHWDERGHNFY